MNKYLIKRGIEGASKIPSEKLDEIGQGSESVLIAMRNVGAKDFKKRPILLFSPRQEPIYIFTITVE